ARPGHRSRRRNPGLWRPDVLRDYQPAEGRCRQGPSGRAGPCGSRPERGRAEPHQPTRCPPDPESDRGPGSYRPDRHARGRRRRLEATEHSDNGGCSGPSASRTLKGVLVMQAKIIPVPMGRPSFIGAPRCEDLDALEADIAIIALPYNTPYDLAWSRGPS